MISQQYLGVIGRVQGVTQRGLAQHARISFPCLSELESGALCLPREETTSVLVKMRGASRADTDAPFGFASKMPSDGGQSNLRIAEWLIVSPSHVRSGANSILCSPVTRPVVMKTRRPSRDASIPPSSAASRFFRYDSRCSIAGAVYEHGDLHCICNLRVWMPSVLPAGNPGAMLLSEFASPPLSTRCRGCVLVSPASTQHTN